MSPTVSEHSTSHHSGLHASPPNTPVIHERPPSPEKKAFHDSNTFLIAVASQERRVLELKEELQKAEVELQNLKKQWAIHEAAKKRNELRQLEPLQPLSAPPNGMCTFTEGDTARADKEQERRKLKPLAIRQPQRTVFSGSRHTKTLSLLSPQTSLAKNTLASESRAPAKTRRGTADGPLKPRTTPDAPTVVEVSPHRPSLSNLPRSTHGQPQDDIVETGKQLVGDLREGLWTFFEDLRQATVGEEIDTSAGSGSRKQISIPKADAKLSGTTPSNGESAIAHFPARGSSLHSKAKLSGEAISKIKSTPLGIDSRHQRSMTIQTVPIDNEGWENWDSPPRQCSPLQSCVGSHKSDSMASPMTDSSTPRTSIGSADATPRPAKVLSSSDERKEIPWPALTKLSPGKLKRTASTLMSEWEKTLTPSAWDTATDSALSQGSAPIKEKKVD